MGYCHPLAQSEHEDADLAKRRSVRALVVLREDHNVDMNLVNTAEDVALAIQHGLDGIVISNHGGRQLDGVPATLDTLRECAPIAKGRISIAVDGGIRQGTDIFKALALGAQHCFVGRIPIWGLAVGSKVFPASLQ